MNEAAQQSLDELQSAVLTLGVAALAVLALLTLFVLAKKMISSSASSGDDEFDKKMTREHNYFLNKRGGYMSGPKGHLP